VPPRILKRARLRRRVYALGAGVAGTAIVAVLVAVAGFVAPGEDDRGPRPAGTAETTSPDGAGGAKVDVSAAPRRFDDLVIDVSEAAPAQSSDANPWLEHTISIENAGAEVVTIDDTRTSTLIGGNRLLVADEGCGYGQPSPGAPIDAGACRRYLDRRTIPPGGRETWTITLFEGLPGMSRLSDGEYELLKGVRFRVGDEAWTHVSVHLEYRVNGSPGS
jgi:hypothetical protein